MMTLIAITFLCALSFAASADTWLMWVSLTFMIVALWLADLLFLDDDMVRSAPRPPHPRQPRPSPARTSIHLFTAVRPHHVSPLLSPRTQFNYDPEYANWARKSAPSYETMM